MVSTTHKSIPPKAIFFIIFFMVEAYQRRSGQQQHPREYGGAVGWWGVRCTVSQCKRLLWL